MIKTQQSTAFACRFCFMCRHLAPIGNVTYREADTPRGRALLFDRASAFPELWRDPDYADTFYRGDLSGACRTHCVSHFDEPGLILAARRHLVELGQAPQAVVDLVRELAAERSVISGEGRGPIAYFVDPYTARHQPEIAKAMEEIFKAAGVQWTVITGSDSGKAANVLGFSNDARLLAGEVAKAVKASGAKTLVTSCPAAYDAFVRDYVELGTPLPGDVEVLHSSEFIARLIEEKRVTGSWSSRVAVYPLASDYLRNYQGKPNGGDLPAGLGIDTIPFGTNQEESYSAGEGAVVMDRLYPKIVEKLANYVAERRNDASDTLLTFSPYTKYALTKFSSVPLKVTTVEELAAEWIRGSGVVSKPAENVGARP